ncbi:MAG: c-type cytochrome biogenesis protein CcsB [Candidatus Nanopelagicales bacterium]
MDTALISNLAVLSSSVVLTIATFFSFIKLTGSKNPAKFARISLSLTALATLLLAVGVVTRGIAAQRAPWGNMYEYAIAGTLAVLLVYLLMSRKQDLSGIAVFVLMPSLLSLGLAQTVLYIPVADLVPALKSGWLVIHVASTIIAGGGFSLGFTFAVGQLVAAKGKSKLAKRLPDEAQLELLSYRVSAWGFAVWTFAVLAGAIWAEEAWGRFWGWDPKETWALITWIAYAAYLHARVTVGWRGGKAAAIAIVGYATYLFNFFGVNILFDGLHSYGGL